MTNKCRVIRICKGNDPWPTYPEAKELAKYGAELIDLSDADKAKTDEALKIADILLYGGVPITRAMMEAATKLIVIMCESVGYDPIDVKAATENNIIVVNLPAFDWCVEEVSNHAIGLLLACAKKMKISDKLVSQGRWSDAKKAQATMGSIYGQTLGIVGCGAIGRMVARKAKCFGLNIIGYDPYIVEVYLARENGIKLTTLEEVFKADYISLHPDLNETSFHMINEKAFAQMKPSACLINTSRGKVVDESALVKALQEGKIAGAGLDVFEMEPLRNDSPLTKMDNVVILPHSAFYSDNAFSLMSMKMGQEIGRILSGKWPLNPVNREVKPRVSLIKGN